jgi:hypothetical protein
VLPDGIDAAKYTILIFVSQFLTQAYRELKNDKKLINLYFSCIKLVFVKRCSLKVVIMSKAPTHMLRLRAKLLAAVNMTSRQNTQEHGSEAELVARRNRADSLKRYRGRPRFR